jgi:hypothetical protein
MVKTRKNKKMVGGAGDYYTQSTAIMKDKRTNEQLDVLKVPEYADNQKLYLDTYGLLKMPKGLDFADEFGNMVDDAYNYLNSDKTKSDVEPHVEFIPSSQGAKYNKVFGKFREYLIKNKDVIANKLVAANTTFKLDYLKMEPDPTSHEFVFVPLVSSVTATTTVSKDDAIEALHAFFETITEDSVISLSPDEMNVITDPDNYENAIYVIGQVFGIIAPGFHGDLLTFDNDELNSLFDPKFFIDLYNTIKPDVSSDNIIKSEYIEGLIL